MSFFPAYAFFINSYYPHQAVKVIINDLAQFFEEITFSFSEVDDSQEFCFSDPEQAISFLNNYPTEEQIYYLWLANDLHTIKFELNSKSYIKSEFWDYGSDIYDEGITEELKEQKIQLGLKLLETLIVGCQGEFAYISSADEEDSGLDIHNQVVLTILENVNNRNVANLLERPFYFWLVAFPTEGIVSQTVKADLQNLYQEKFRTLQVVIYKHKQHHPYFEHS